MTLQLQNPRDVPAEWAIKAPTEVGAAKDWAFFECTPSEGVLGAGKKIMLQV